jgi:hypothetical protein
LRGGGAGATAAGGLAKEARDSAIADRPLKIEDLQQTG